MHYKSFDEVIKVLEDHPAGAEITFPIEGPRWADIKGLIKSTALMYDIKVIEVEEIKGLLRKAVYTKVSGDGPELISFLRAIQSVID